MTHLGWIVGVIAALSLAGCGPLMKAAGFPVDQRRVVAKEAPSVLIADDGARCTVTQGRWQEVEIGDEVYCAWG